MDKNSNPDKKKNKFLVRPLRTYKDDIARFIKTKKISTTKIVMAEARRRRKQTKEIQKEGANDRRKKMSFSISFTLITLGILLVVIAVIFLKPVSKINNFITGITANDQLIDQELKINIILDGKTDAKIREIIKYNINNPPSLTENELVEFTIKQTEDSVDGKGATLKKISLNKFNLVMGLKIPDKIVRSLHPNYILGLINTDAGASPILWFKVANFDLVYSEMLEWEKYMYQSINNVFFKTLGTSNSVEKIITTNQINSTSTPEISRTFFDPRAFTDLIIFNRDTRVIKNNHGQILFYYSFIDRENLILATEKEVIKKILNKISLQKQVR